MICYYYLPNENLTESIPSYVITDYLNYIEMCSAKDSFINSKKTNLDTLINI